MSLFKKLLQGIKEVINYKSPLRPPGALKEKDFIKRCIKCNKCAQICPYDSIVMADISWGVNMGTSMIFPRKVPCYVCMKCTAVCPTGALDTSVDAKEKVKMGIAEIDTEKCLPYLGVICRACFEQCPIFREAIYLEEEMYPKVNTDKCIGCGICERVCPAEGSAIIVKSANIIV